MSAKSKSTTPAAEPPPASAGKRAYRVTAMALQHDGVLYAVGDTVELTDAEAEGLGGVVLPVPQSPTHSPQPE